MTALIRPIVYPQPYEDESPIGYLIRVAKNNAYGSYQWLMSDEQSARTLLPGKLLRLLVSTPWSGFAKIEKTISPVCYLPPVRLNTTSLRYCSECLKEDLYYRMGWQMKSSVVCIKHQCWLCDTCPVCRADFAYKSHQLGVCSCGYHLAEAQAQKAPKGVIRVQSFIDGTLPLSGTVFWLSGASKIDNFSLETRIQLVNFFAQWQPVDVDAFSKTGTFVGLNTMLSARRYMLSLADSLFSSKVSFYKFLSALHHDVYSDGNAGDALFRQFYKSLYKHCEHELFHPIRDQLEKYINEHWVYPLTHKNALFSDSTIDRHPWVALQTLSRDYEIGKSVIKKAIENQDVRAELKIAESRSTLLVYRPDVLKLIDRQKAFVNAVVAAGILGVTKKQFYLLLEHGVLVGGTPPGKSNTHNWEFPRNVLHQFVDSFVRVLPLLEDSYLSFPEAIRWIGGQVDEPFLSLLFAVQNGELKAKRSAEGIGLRGIFIEKNELKSWCQDKVRNKFNSAYTHKMLVEFLRIPPFLASELVGEGIIDHFTQAKSTRRLVSEKALEEFKDRYVILSKVSKLTHTSTEQLISSINSHGIHPIDDAWGNKPKLSHKVYFRHELLAIREIQAIVGAGADWEC